MLGQQQCQDEQKYGNRMPPGPPPQRLNGVEVPPWMYDLFTRENQRIVNEMFMMHMDTAKRITVNEDRMGVVNKNLQKKMNTMMKLIVEIPELVAEKRALTEVLAQRGETNVARKQNYRDAVELRAEEQDRKANLKRQQAENLENAKAERLAKFGGNRRSNSHQVNAMNDDTFLEDGMRAASMNDHNSPRRFGPDGTPILS